MPFDSYIDYTKYPRFHAKSPNQAYEEGFFFADGKFYFYYDDRHENNYEVSVIAESMAEFEEYCDDASLDIPDSFLDAVG